MKVFKVGLIKAAFNTLPDDKDTTIKGIVQFLEPYGDEWYIDCGRWECVKKGKRPPTKEIGDS